MKKVNMKKVNSFSKAEHQEFLLVKYAYGLQMETLLNLKCRIGTRHYVFLAHRAKIHFINMWLLSHL